MDIAITRMSSKGQVVIPAEMREDIEEGEKLLLIRNEGQIFMKKVSDLDTQFDEDLKAARRAEAALKRFEQGKFRKMTGEEFLKEIKRW